MVWVCCRNSQDTLRGAEGISSGKEVKVQANSRTQAGGQNQNQLDVSRHSLMWDAHSRALATSTEYHQSPQVIEHTSCKDDAGRCQPRVTGEAPSREGTPSWQYAHRAPGREDSYRRMTVRGKEVGPHGPEVPFSESPQWSAQRPSWRWRVGS